MKNLNEDIQTMTSLKSAVELLHAYANDELELQGHSQEVATALILTLQQSSKLLETIQQLDAQLVERCKEMFHISPT